MFLAAIDRSMKAVPRTAKTLIALVAAMTAGMLLLLALQTDRLGPPLADFAAAVAPGSAYAEAVEDTSVPIRPEQWRNIVVHSSLCSVRDDPAGRCHFLVRYDAEAAEASVEPTKLWRRQAEGSHIFAPGRDWNADSVGVYVEGRPGRDGFPAAQRQGAVKLIQALQRALRISADHVYLHRDLDAQSDCPGEALSL